MLGLPLEDARRSRSDRLAVAGPAAGANPAVFDALGTPKSAWHGLAQVLPPTPALIINEGLDGLAVHLINETAASIAARLNSHAFVTAR
jgi:hypothetical protein